MIEEIMKQAVSNGIWALLFCFLLLYLLKDGRARELKYQETIKDLNTSVAAVREIAKSVDEIKEDVNDMKEGISVLRAKKQQKGKKTAANAVN